MTGAAESKPVLLCPKGHASRTLFGKHRCSALKCGEERYQEEKVRKAAERADPSLKSPLVPSQASKDLSPEDMEAARLFLKRARLSKLPKNLKGEAATKWAQEKLVSLLPEAIASVAYDLRNGSNAQRAAATETVLKANGLDRREASNTQGGLIVLNIGQSQAAAVPWLQRMQTAVLPKQAAELKAVSEEDE